MHRRILHNDEILDSGERCTSPGQVGLLNGWGVFSTMRVSSGVIFAFERHIARMRFDAERLHVPFPDKSDWMHSRLMALIDANKAWDSTLRVVVLRNHGGPYEGPGIDRKYDLIGFTTDLVDWPNTVTLGLKAHGRHAASEFSGAKMLSWSFNLIWNEEAHQRGFDEVVLLNERGEVSECTSANIFIIQGDQVWTPPLSSGCLPGVTRALLLEEIAVPGIQFAEKKILPEDLERADRVFITSTTRDALPVRTIETLSLQSGGERALAEIQSALSHFRFEYTSRNTPTTAYGGF